MYRNPRPQGFAAWGKKTKFLAVIIALFVLFFIYNATKVHVENTLLAVDLTQKVCDEGRVVQLRWSPRVAIYKEFLSNSELASLMTAAKDSIISNPNINNATQTSSRAAKFNFPKELEKTIQDRIAVWALLPPTHAEKFVVRNYVVGEYHLNHPDYLVGDRASFGIGGQRNLLVYIVLKTADAGGVLRFPNSDLTVAPNAGDALIIHTRLPNGQIDPMSSYEETAVMRGDKWVLTQFFREAETSNAAAFGQFGNPLATR